MIVMKSVQVYTLRLTASLIVRLIGLLLVIALLRQQKKSNDIANFVLPLRGER